MSQQTVTKPSVSVAAMDQSPPPIYIKRYNPGTMIQVQLRRFYEEDRFFDLHMICQGGISVKCHSLIAAAYSPILEKFITTYGSLRGPRINRFVTDITPVKNHFLRNDKNDYVISFAHFAAEHLKAVVRYLYSGEVYINSLEEVSSIWRVASSLQIRGFPTKEFLIDEFIRRQISKNVPLISDQTNTYSEGSKFSTPNADGSTGSSRINYNITDATTGDTVNQSVVSSNDNVNPVPNKLVILGYVCSQFLMPAKPTEHNSLVSTSSAKKNYIHLESDSYSSEDAIKSEIDQQNLQTNKAAYQNKRQKQKVFSGIQRACAIRDLQRGFKLNEVALRNNVSKKLVSRWNHEQRIVDIQKRRKDVKRFSREVVTSSDEEEVKSPQTKILTPSLWYLVP